MKLRIEDKTTKTIHYTQETDDSDYGTCLWADFTIDADRLTLVIQSGGGNMQYAWNNIGDNTPGGFYRFLAKLDKEYLLSKISDRTRFDFDATVQHLTPWLEDNRPALARAVHDMYPCPNEHVFAAQYLALPKSHTDDLECVVMDYPAEHKAVADIFCHHVQPALSTCIAPEADAYFKEVEADYTAAELAGLVAKLNPRKQYVPIEVDGDCSLAFGFIESETYDGLLCDDFGRFSTEMHMVLADMAKESSDWLYTFAGVRTYLYR